MASAAIHPEARPDAAAPTHAWDKAAQGWNSNAALIRVWLAGATVAMMDAAGITQGDRVLDIAAGAGDQTLDIARRVGPEGHVLATDISPRIMALAQSNAHQAGMAQVDTLVADAQSLTESLGFTRSNFDAAVCRLGLMFCTRPLDALTGARKVLKPRGRLAALVFSQPQHNPCLAVMMSTALRAAGLPPKSPFEPGTLMSLGRPGLLAQLLHEAGFVDISVTHLPAPFCTPTVRHYVDFVRTSGSPIMEILATLAPSAQDGVWRDIESQLRIFTTPEGWRGPNELLLCAATVPDAHAL